MGYARMNHATWEEHTVRINYLEEGIVLERTDRRPRWLE